MRSNTNIIQIVQSHLARRRAKKEHYPSCTNVTQRYSIAEAVGRYLELRLFQRQATKQTLSYLVTAGLL
jgi:hypothetical protein